jgi:translocation and assembly module TamB
MWLHSAASRKAEAERRQREARQAAQQASASASPNTAKVPDILLNLNLGRDFALQGFGITTRLRGQLMRGGSTLSAPRRSRARCAPNKAATVPGDSRWTWSGLVRFNGPYNNPSLDITAIRPNITVRGRRAVLGSATAPRVTLFSDPEMSDAEKLS